MAGSIKHAKLIPSALRSLSSKSLLRQSTYAPVQPTRLESFSPPASTSPTTMYRSPLSVLPLTSLLRSILINTTSSSPVLLPPSLKIIGVLAHSQSPLLNPDRNPILRWILKKTFYAQFCAGENAKEVQRTVSSLKNTGFKGVMLCYAKEVVLDEKANRALESGGDSAASKLFIEQEILPWKKGTMETVAMTQPGDFVAVKYENL